MGSPHSDHTVAQDADRITTAYNSGVSVDCVLGSMNRDQQIAVYKELNRRHEAQPNDPHIPDFGLSLDNSGVHFVRKDGQPDNTKTCYIQPQEKPMPLPKVTIRDSSRETTYQSELYAHPERSAARIETTAQSALNGDEKAKLDLRVQMEDLMHQPKEYREKVLAQMKEDGSYSVGHLRSDAPHVVVKPDAAGNLSVEFSKNLGLDKQTIPLNQSVEQQVAQAQKNYVNALRNVTGGLGKFDPDGTMRAMDILDGVEPTNLKWFMLYRKQQGRPAVDLSENSN